MIPAKIKFVHKSISKAIFCSKFEFWAQTMKDENEIDLDTACTTSTLLAFLSYHTPSTLAKNIISQGDSLHYVPDAASRGRGLRLDLSELSNVST